MGEREGERIYKNSIANVAERFVCMYTCMYKHVCLCKHNHEMWVGMAAQRHFMDND